jgi:hypothetical protein
MTDRKDRKAQPWSDAKPTPRFNNATSAANGADAYEERLERKHAARMLAEIRKPEPDSSFIIDRARKLGW